MKHVKKMLKKVFFAEKWNGSMKYWDDRYKRGGDSGAGSYEKLALFKSEIINEFVKRNHIKSVVEWG